MVLPNVWGQGQLFAFSALDGKSLRTDDFVGILSADKLGVRFFSTIKRELALIGLRGLNPVFKAVTGDFISITTDLNEDMNIIYADTHLIIGNTVGTVYPAVMVEGKSQTIEKNYIEIHDSKDGEYTAIGRIQNKFAFAYGKSMNDVVSLVEKGLNLNINEEIKKKLRYYELNSLAPDNKYALLYSKCLSVMKTQLYSPEGRFKKIWSTPDRLPHRSLWLWDSVFHALGFKNIDGNLAEDLILDVFDAQSDTGFIPHLASPTYASEITQPPVIAWGAYQVYQETKNINFLKAIFENNKRFLLWCQNNRRDTDEELYTWLTDDDVNCRCDESGMDNSPRFDTDHRLQAIDFSCFMANETRYMKKIADILCDDESSLFFSNWFKKIKTIINNKLWCDEDKFYYDYDITDNKYHKVQSVASFLPLFSGVCNENQAEALFNHLTNPETFYSEFAIPSVSKQDKTFGSDMWRGPVWVNYNYMISLGLYDYGYSKLADEIETKTIDVLNFWYKKTGTMFEFYDCENKRAPYELNRKGLPYEPYDITVRCQSIREYGWTTTLLFDLLNKKVKGTK